jgi:ribose-phosphate pyrophosphokinase
MKVINLTEKNKVRDHEILKFPDGQRDIRLINFDEYLNEDYVQIESRFNSFEDLGLIICTTKALRRVGVKNIRLFIPYLLGARSDRQFQEGGNSYLVDIVAPIINDQNYEKVIVLDPHSDVAAACIKNLQILDNTYIVSSALLEIYRGKPKDDQIVLISPDAGALKKIYHVAEKLKFKGEVITAMKHRDIITGKIVSTHVPLNMTHAKKDFIIIDDICDGGRTFIEVAKVIKETFNDAKIYLIISHGIFSNSFTELSKYFTGIFCSNSVSNIDPHEHSDYTIPHNYLFKQFNVI